MYAVLRDDFDAVNIFYGVFEDFHMATVAIQDNMPSAVKINETTYGIMPLRVQPLNPENTEIYYGITYNIQYIKLNEWDVPR